jgi:tetratricopeptide (TPR) repeat protein
MNMLYRYPGLQSFSEEDANVFCGRDQEKEEFLSRLLHDKLVVLYGQPGIGKLSFLKAGILPALKQKLKHSSSAHNNIYSYIIRFDTYQGEKSEGLAMQLYHQVCQAENIAELKKLNYVIPANEYILWSHFKRKELDLVTNEKNHYILIFEHIEEIFSYPEVQLRWFNSVIGDLIGEFAPVSIRSYLENEEMTTDNVDVKRHFRILQKEVPVKIIFSIGNEKFYLLARLRDFLPAIFKSVIELEPMTEEQARLAIVEPAAKDMVVKNPDGREVTYKTNPFGYAAAAVQAIVDFVNRPTYGQFHNNENAINTYCLQIICSYCERKLVEEKKLSVITVSDVLDLKQIIEDYYKEIINRLALGEADKQIITGLLEKEMIYEADKQRLVLYEKVMLEKCGNRKDLLEKLLETRLIRKEHDSSGRNFYEIWNDILAEAILESSLKNKQDAVTVTGKEIDLDTLKELNNRVEKNPQDYYNYKSRADFYYFSKRYNEAITDYCKALDLNQHDYELPNYLGVIYLETGDYKKAIDFFKLSYKKNEGYDKPLYNLGITHAYLGKLNNSKKDIKKAIDYFNKALKINPGYVDSYNQLGLIYEAGGNYEKAERYFKKAIELNLNYLDAHLNLGNVYYRQNKMTEARQCYDEVLALDNKNASAIYNIGLVYQQARNDEQAISCFKKAIELAPDFELALEAAAIFYISKHQNDEALALLNKVINPGDGVPGLYMTLAKNYRDEKKLDKSEECLNRIVQLKPGDLNATNNLGLLLFDQQKYPEALKIFEEIKAKDPGYFNAWINAGLVYDHFKDYESAKNNFMTAAAIDPENYLAPLNLARLYKKINEYNLSLDAYEKLIRINEKANQEDKIEIRLELSELYIRLNLPDKAIENLVAYLELYKSDALAYKYQSAAYDLKKYLEKAFKTFYSFLTNSVQSELTLEDYKQYVLLYEKAKTGDQNFATQLSSDELNYLGIAYEYSRDLNSAEQIYNLAVKKDTTNYYPAFNLGYILEIQKKNEMANEWYRKAHQINPEKYEPIFGIANTCFVLSEYDEAESWFQKASEKQPENPEVLLSLGNIAYLKGDFTNATSLYLRSLEKRKEEVILNNLGAVAHRQGYVDKAITYNLEAVELNPDYESPFDNLGAVYADKKEYHRAFEFFEKALRVSKSQDAFAISDLGVLYHKLGLESQALHLMNKSIHLEQKNDETYYNLANYYFENGDEQLTEENLELVFKINRHHKFSRILKSKLLRSKGKFEESSKWLQETIESDLADPFPKLEMALLNIAWEKFGEAQKMLEELNVIPFDSFNKLMWMLPEAFGQLHEARKEYEAALNYYQKALELDPRNADIIKKGIAICGFIKNSNVKETLRQQLSNTQASIKKETTHWIEYSFFLDIIKHTGAEV